MMSDLAHHTAAVYALKQTNQPKKVQMNIKNDQMNILLGM